MDDSRTARVGTGWYEIRLQGQLSPRWADRFDGMTLTVHADGTTVVAGDVVDQAALHGLLRIVGDLGLPLLSVRRMVRDPSSSAQPSPRRSPAPNHEPIIETQGD